MKSDRHLDLACGKFPRNPYRRKQLFGVDIRAITPEDAPDGFEYKQANLLAQNIPFDDHYFLSVSAFDFLEHVPRICPYENGNVRYPFIDLMNEVHRILEPGGRFYALTPFFPRPEAFQDPTHVNFITKGTHSYFCGEKPLGRIYGFKGNFRCIRSHRVPSSIAKDGLNDSFSQKLVFLRKYLKGQLSHLIWEFEAIK
jgi:SAM-dependent methyltransferase